MEPRPRPSTGLPTDRRLKHLGGTRYPRLKEGWQMHLLIYSKLLRNTYGMMRRPSGVLTRTTQRPSARWKAESKARLLFVFEII